MTEDKINKLIADTETYLNNLSKRNTNKIYIENFTLFAKKNKENIR